MIRFFLKWLISWATLAQGLVGILTLGFYSPKWELGAAKVYSGYMHKTRCWSQLYDQGMYTYRT